MTTDTQAGTTQGPCPECKGRGTVSLAKDDPRYKITFEWDTCPKCKGTGKAEKRRQNDTKAEPDPMAHMAKEFHPPKEPQSLTDIYDKGFNTPGIPEKMRHLMGLLRVSGDASARMIGSYSVRQQRLEKALRGLRDAYREQVLEWGGETEVAEDELIAEADYLLSPECCFVDEPMPEAEAVPVMKDSAEGFNGTAKAILYLASCVYRDVGEEGMKRIENILKGIE